MKARANRFAPALILAVALILGACSSRSAPPDIEPAHSGDDSSDSSLVIYTTPDLPLSDFEAPESAEELATNNGDEPPEPEVSTPETSENSQEESQADEDGEAEEAAPAGEFTAYNYEIADVQALYVRNYSDFTYSPLGGDEAGAAISILRRAVLVEPEEIYSQNAAGFFVVLNDPERTRFSYTLIPTAVRIDGEAHPISQEDYNTLLQAANSAFTNHPAFIQWLVFMDSSRVETISYQPDTADVAISVPAANISGAVSTLASIQVKKGTGNTYEIGEKSFDAAPGRTVYRLAFSGDITYSIGIEGSTLYIESSDMTYGCVYQMLTSAVDVERTFKSLCA